MALRKMNRVEVAAWQAAKARGHAMGLFRPLDRYTSVSRCLGCGAEVVANTRPAANEVDVGGEAVAMECPHPMRGYKGNPPLRGVKPVGSNMTEAEHGQVLILYSYQTPVAVWVRGLGVVATDKRHSVTTSKHIKKWVQENNFTLVGKVTQEAIDSIAETGDPGPYVPRTLWEGRARTRAIPLREEDRESNPPRRGKKPEHPSLGSISTGTLREEDLLIEFVGALRGWHEKQGTEYRVRSLIASVGDMLDAMRDPEAAQTYGLDPDNDAPELVNELADALNELAPPYAYFGALEGDGSDFGFWPSWQQIEDDVRSGELLNVSDTSEVPRGYTGMVIHVNDHGNATLYRATRGRLREVWSVV